MSWVKCNLNLYMTPIMREVTKPIHPKDGFMPARESIFIRLLAYCASGYEFGDVKQFSKVTIMPIKQCQIVWDICIQNNVLRQSENGFSVKEWLLEYGFLDGLKKADKMRSNARTDEPSASMPEYKKSEPVQIDAQKKAIQDIPVAQPQISQPIESLRGINKQEKIKFRVNVLLSENEMNDLKCSFSEEQINLMLDYLSEYKEKTQRNYASDYQAIRRWVIKWFNQTHGQQSQLPKQQQPSEFPDWLTGKKP